VAIEEAGEHVHLRGVLARETELLVLVGGLVEFIVLRVEGDAHLVAAHVGDEALLLEDLPRQIVALGSDETEHVAFAAVLAHEGRGQTEPAAALQGRGRAEHRCREEVDLVVDEEPQSGVLEQGWRWPNSASLDARHVRIWYVATVTGRICFVSPVYIPTSFSVRFVLSRISRIHWLTAAWFVARMSVFVCASSIARMPTIVFPAPHASTTTPLPPDGLPSWYQRSAAMRW
jgi:hypothetical protein